MYDFYYLVKRKLGLGFGEGRYFFCRIRRRRNSEIARAALVVLLRRNSQAKCVAAELWNCGSLQLCKTN